MSERCPHCNSTDLHWDTAHGAKCRVCRRSFRAPEPKPAEPVVRYAELSCPSCHGSGIVGRAPDDYRDCPECASRDLEVKPSHDFQRQTEVTKFTGIPSTADERHARTWTITNDSEYDFHVEGPPIKRGETIRVREVKK